VREGADDPAAAPVTHAPPTPCPPAPSQVRVGRAYGRVSRRLLRNHLLQLCAAAGVRYMPEAVAAIDTPEGAGALATVGTTGGSHVTARMVALASGQAAGRFLKYEDGAPGVAAQTAYGIEAEVEG
jgi:lycopene epsilon-cyclase